MEKESLIKVGVLSLVILAIAIPILTTCMAGLQKDGYGETYDVEVKGVTGNAEDEYLPASARDMVEYAKEKGATAWTVEYDLWVVHSITLYKGSRIIEQTIYEIDGETGLGSHGGPGGKFVWEGGYGEIWYHSATPYFGSAPDGINGGEKYIIRNEGKKTTIEYYHYNQDVPYYTKNVKMEHAWIPAGYHFDSEGSYYDQFEYVYLCWFSPENYRPMFIDVDDIHWYGYINGHFVYLHGNDLIGYVDNELVKGTVEYSYTEEEDTSLKTLTNIHMTFDGYSIDVNEEYMGINGYTGFNTITPAHLVYKEPYVGPTLGAMLSVIPIVALAGIGIYLFHKFRSNAE